MSSTSLGSPCRPQLRGVRRWSRAAKSSPQSAMERPAPQCKQTGVRPLSRTSSLRPGSGVRQPCGRRLAFQRQCVARMTEGHGNGQRVVAGHGMFAPHGVESRNHGLTDRNVVGGLVQGLCHQAQQGFQRATGRA